MPLMHASGEHNSRGKTCGLPPELAPEAHHAQLKAAICRETTRACVGECGSNLRSIILTGSHARNEGTFISRGEAWKVLGDAEFVLVLQSRHRVPVTSQTELLRSRIQDALAAQQIDCEIGLSPVEPAFLRKIRPSIFAYELKTCGQVIWGEPQILDLMPRFEIADIPLEDGWRLLQNRIVEMVDLPREMPTELPRQMYYRAVKLYLDMATSLLVFASAYAPQYREREQRLRALTAGKEARSWPFAMDAFTEIVSACTQWKLNGDQIGSEATWNFWKDAVTYSHQLWRWELMIMTGCGPQPTDRELMQAWMTQQPFRDRLRGWLFALRAQGWVRSWRDWRRWLRHAPQASPRYWVYTAASEFLFSIPLALESGRSCDNRQWKNSLECLPLRTKRFESPDYYQIASEISFNYTTLLRETRT